MPRHPSPVSTAAAARAALLCACVPPTEASEEQSKAWDVRGDYDLTFDDQITLRLDIGGAVRERTANGWGEVVDFGTVNGKPVTLDLAAHCAKPAVACPSEVYGDAVAINQVDVHKKQNLYGLKVRDRRPASEGGTGKVLDGILDHAKQDAFVIGLGAKAGATGGGGAGCAALALSIAEGQFRRDAGGAVDGIDKGRVKLGWLGGCAFGPLLLGATLTVETGYTGKRVGDVSLPAAATGT